MTLDELLALPERKRDALVAGKVMGWHVDRWRPDFNEPVDCWYRTHPGPWLVHEGSGKTKRVPRFSTDIAAAWGIIAHLAPTHFCEIRTPVAGGMAWVSFQWHAARWYRRALSCPSLEQIPAAICAAALEAIDARP